MTRDNRQKGRPERDIRHQMLPSRAARSLLHVVRTSVHDPTYVLPLLVLGRELLERTQVLVFLTYVRTAAVIQHTPRISLRAGRPSADVAPTERTYGIPCMRIRTQTSHSIGLGPSPPQSERSLSFKFQICVTGTNVHFPDTRNVLELDLTFVAIVTSKLHSCLGH
jgi:hypothetical protein